MRRLLLRVALLVALFLTTGIGSEPPPTRGSGWLRAREVALRRPGESWQPGYDWEPLTELVDREVAARSLEGASLLIIVDGRVVYERTFGRYKLDEQVAIASGSKWLSAATIMALVDDGRLALDDPVSRYLPGFDGPKAAITIRQLLSHTSGLVPEPACLGDGGASLAQCVDSIAEEGLIAKPGSLFHYGGGSFQVAGRVAEAVTGKPWSALFAEEIGNPLGMESTNYGATANPVIGGGAVSTLRDYGAFLRMLLNRGYAGTERVLSPAAVREMESIQTGGLPIAVSLHPDGRPYGLGLWLDRTDDRGRALQVSSQGDTGFSPWIDRERNMGGVFLTESGLGNVYNLVAEIQARAREIVDASQHR